MSWLYEWVDEGVQSHRWHGLVYWNPIRGHRLMVAWPLNYTVRVWHWLGYRWDRLRSRPSWIDKMMRDAVRKSLENERSFGPHE
jgi:hypothetical protein